MEHLQDYEIAEILNNLKYSDMNQWESARSIIYTIASMFSKKTLTPHEILTFPWEQQTDDREKDTRITDEEIADLKAKAAQITKQRYNI